MKEFDQGRFCSNCQKTVVDFTLLTNKEIVDYFAQNKTIPCGRFHRSQVNSNLLSPAVKKKKGITFQKVAIALLSFFSLKEASVFAQSSITTTTQPLSKKDITDTASKNVVINGTVKNEEQKPIENAAVFFDGKLVATSDKEGMFHFSFSIESPSKSSLLSIAFTGLSTVVRSYHPTMQSTSYNVILEKPHALDAHTMGVPVTFYFTPQTFEMPIEMNGNFRARLSALADTFRNNPTSRIQLVAYGTTQKEIHSAKELLAATKAYFVEREGISDDRFFIKIKPMRKGKKRTFDVEPYSE